MQNSLIEKINRSQLKKLPRVNVGDNVTVHVRLKEGDKERVQPFRGVVISRKHRSNKGVSAKITVRKISEGVGVERVFPLVSPAIEKIEVHTAAEVRRSKLYYLRELKGKKARLKSKEHFGDFVVPEEVEEEIVPELAEPVEEEAKAEAVGDQPAEAKAEDRPAEDKKPG